MLAAKLCVVVCVTCLGSACQTEESAPAQILESAAKGAASNDTSLARLELGEPVYSGQIQKLEAGGAMQLALAPHRQPLPRPRRGTPPREEVLLGIVEPSAAGGAAETRLIRVKAAPGPAQGQISVQADATAAQQLKIGERIALYRAAAATPQQLQSVPPLAVLTRSPAASLVQSQARLKQIAAAFHDFHDTHLCFPPSVLRGPDGKPWHSWRVLLLPHLNERALYEEYKWDEPWDGPNNGKLLARMPDVFRDPAQSATASAEQCSYTHYAVVSGEGTAFLNEGRQYDSPFAVLPGKGPRIGLSAIKDGTQCTLLAGELGADAKIPWTKPQDLTSADVIAQLGGPNSLAANYETTQGPAAAVVFVDLSVQLLPRDTKPETLKALLTIADGQFVSERELPGILSGGIRPVLLLAIDKSPTGVSFRLDAELKSDDEPIPGRGGKLSLPNPAVKPQGVRGIVRYSGMPFSGGLAIVFHSPHVTQRATLAKDGTYSIKLPPDKYQVYFEPQPPDAKFTLDSKYAKPQTTPISAVVRAHPEPIELTFDLGR